MKVEGVSVPSQLLLETVGLDSLPSYDGDGIGQSSTRSQHAESERDDLGTIVTEITITRKRYRVEDA